MSLTRKKIKWLFKTYYISLITKTQYLIHIFKNTVIGIYILLLIESYNDKLSST